MIIEDIEWATTPLLRQENIGKYVWSCWNGNHKHAARIKITKIGRTNIQCGHRDSYRVDGETGYKENEMCFTERYRVERSVREDLTQRFYRRQHMINGLPIEDLTRLVETLEAAL